MASKGKKTPEHELLAALKIAEAGTPVPEVCR